MVFNISEKRSNILVKIGTMLILIVSKPIEVVVVVVVVVFVEEN